MSRYVNLDKALELFDADMNFYNQNGEVIGKLAHISAFQKMAREKLLLLPLADIVEQKKGKWIKRSVSLYRCSECGRFHPAQENFCPNCGADMREENTDEV